MNSIIIVALVGAFFGLANGQLNQTCVHTTIVTPRHFFETDKALGKWYPQEIYTGLADDAKPVLFKCLTTNFYRNSTTNPKILAVNETFLNMESGVVETYPGDIKINEDFPNEAIWVATSMVDGEIRTSDSVWLQTDYENWSVSFGCRVVDNYRYETLVISSRTPVLDPATMKILRTLAVGYGFPLQNVRAIDQTNC